MNFHGKDIKIFAGNSEDKEDIQEKENYHEFSRQRHQNLRRQFKC